MNAYAARSADNPLGAIFWTLISGLVPGLVLLVAILYIRRNTNNRLLCIILAIIAIVWTVLWAGTFAWAFGGSTSIHPGQPIKVH